MADGPLHGTIIWNELNTPDPEAARAFYATMFGWSFSAFPMADGEYWIIRHGDKDLGGIFPLTAPEFRDIPAHWLTYFAVDDVDAQVAAAVEAGGAVAKAPFDVPGVGRIAVVQDATGAYMAWMTPRM
ncbi:VOC family protein [Ancylobacter sp. A5.8]|uniref:VOC family protein n=1 Tax=Ancylobacter gelatini TaxID=2919920 RepID=UPI001F4EA04E|nr:VOC family protein [Ancylobacter gelatini]MCJ8143490.1 VOC family protein [Ancylobacter gelatini]